MYIREAHPSDGRQTRQNIRDRVIYRQPKTFAERVKVASACHDSLKMTIPTVVDRMDNAVNKAYSGAPDRLCVVDVDGKVAYYSQRGPWGFKPRDAEKALKEILANGGRIRAAGKTRVKIGTEVRR